MNLQWERDLRKSTRELTLHPEPPVERTRIREGAQRTDSPIGTENAQPLVGESMNGPWSESRDAGNPHVRFDERDLERYGLIVTAPDLDSTVKTEVTSSHCGILHRSEISKDL